MPGVSRGIWQARKRQCRAFNILTGDDPRNRMAIVRRTDGYYAIRLERWDEEAVWHEGSITGGWLPSEWECGIFGGVTLAEKQAYADYRGLEHQMAVAEIRPPSPLSASPVRVANWTLRLIHR